MDSLGFPTTKISVGVLVLKLTLKILTIISLVMIFGKNASATTMVQRSDSNLARSSSIVALANVLQVRHARPFNGGAIFTCAWLKITQVIKGNLLPDEKVRVCNLGGKFKSDSFLIEGSPKFKKNEDVLVFLTQMPSGNITVTDLAVGKFTVTTDPDDGIEIVNRDSDDIRAVMFQGGLATTSQPIPNSFTLTDFLSLITEATADQPSDFLKPTNENLNFEDLPTVTGPATLNLLPLTVDGISTNSGFTLFNKVRWALPDSGSSIQYLLDSRGDSLMGFNTNSLIQSSMNAWSNVSSANLDMRVSGNALPKTGGSSFCNGQSMVSFEDPFKEVTDPNGCSGILAIGGYCSVGNHIFQNSIYSTISEGDIVFNDGWSQSCPKIFKNLSNLSEVATHEMGHTLGIAHSTNTDSTMYNFAHFDGRGANITQDDKNAVSTLYPCTGVGCGIAEPPPPPNPVPGASLNIKRFSLRKLKAASRDQFTFVSQFTLPNQNQSRDFNVRSIRTNPFSVSFLNSQSEKLFEESINLSLSTERNSGDLFLSNNDSGIKFKTKIEKDGQTIELKLAIKKRVLSFNPHMTILKINVAGHIFSKQLFCQVNRSGTKYICN